ncbi:MAG: hypothetical protein ABIJ27_04330 [Candidatus Omnitrophota bacterium]
MAPKKSVKSGIAKKAKTTTASKSKSYRMRCPKTANGLSHFVMYGDIKEKETLL